MKIEWDLAEYSLLGAILLGNEDALKAARQIVKASEIKQPQIKACYEAACKLADAGKPVDVSVIQAEAQKSGCVVEDSYLIKAMEVTVTAANVTMYATAVHENWQTRQLQELGSRLMGAEVEDPKDVIRDALDSLQSIQQSTTTKFDNPTDTMMDFYDYLIQTSTSSRAPFLSTGFHELDESLGGGMVSPGVITLAARPGVGKSMMALNIAENVAAAGNAVLYVSLEMSKNQLLARRVGKLSGVSYNRIMRGDIKDTANGASEWTKVTQAMSQMSERPLYIADRTCGMADIEIMGRSVPDLRLLVIDHMGLIQHETSGKLYEQVTATSHEILALSKKLNVPVLSLCQLNRESENRNDKKPKLADLRNSGAIEEDSDVVMLLHREAMYLPKENQPNPWEAQRMDVDIAKNRHGTTGEVAMKFIGLTGSIWESD